MLGLQHLNVPHLRGRTTVGRSGENNKRDEPEQEPTEGKRSAEEEDELERRADEEDELETTGSGNGNDSDEMNHIDAKRTRRPKTTLMREYRWVREHQNRKGEKKADIGLRSRQADHIGQGARAERQVGRRSLGKEPTE